MGPWSRLRGLARRRPADWRESLPVLVLGLAVVAVAARLATLVVRVLPTRARPATVQRPIGAPAVIGRELDTVVSAHLFGNPNAPSSGANAPQTQVPLVLSGTLAVNDPKAGLAIIGETAVAGRLYAVGSAVPGGVSLEEVYADRVVLKRNGALETLLLPRGTLAAGVSPAGARAAPSSAPTAAATSNRDARRMLDRMPSVIGEVMRPMPSYSNGQLKGFKLYAGKDRERFQELGLQPGDLVTHVNGVPLGDAQHGMEVLRTLTGGGSTTVTLERDGTPQQITIDASQVAALTGAGGAPAPAPSPPANPP
jgi:general secretion pathway protein C